MNTSENKGFPAYIRLTNIVVDLMCILLLSVLIFQDVARSNMYLCIYAFCSWSIIGYFSGFYEVYPFTKPGKIVAKVAVQLVLNTVAMFFFLLFSAHTVVGLAVLAGYAAVCALPVLVLKLFVYVYLNAYKAKCRCGNTVIVGYNATSLQVKEALSRHNDNAVLGFFSDRDSGANITGGIAQLDSYIQNNGVNTVYCSVSEATTQQINHLATLCETKGIRFKLVPDGGVTILPKKFRISYYEVFPSFTLYRTPLHDPIARLLKRIFDVVFSLLVIVFIMSWLIPIVGLFIKLESKGPVFFKQIRLGVDGKDFWCYKFRSMQVANNEGNLTVKNDPRVTRTGKFLRKTSLDEMPQFINVLIGDMSVVGPRPKVYSHHNQYKDHIYRFMDRLKIKPGITGLAQVSGYRGEINSDGEMQNRIRYDVFYIEHWSMLFDMKIIMQTVVNIFMGEDKAY